MAEYIIIDLVVLFMTAWLLKGAEPHLMSYTKYLMGNTD